MIKKLFLCFVFFQLFWTRSPFCGGSVGINFTKKRDTVKLCVPNAKNIKTGDTEALNKKTNINPYGVEISCGALMPMNDYFLIGISGGFYFSPMNNTDEDMTEKINIKHNIFSFYGGISIGVFSTPTNLTIVNGFVLKDKFKIVPYGRTDFETFHIDPIHFGIKIENCTAISKKVFFKISAERIFKTSSSYNDVKLDTSGTNFGIGVELKI